jgi:hypothetical protein
MLVQPPWPPLNTALVDKASSPEVMVDHLRGRITCGWYCLDKGNQIRWACADANSEDEQKLLRGRDINKTGLLLTFRVVSNFEGQFAIDALKLG